MIVGLPNPSASSVFMSLAYTEEQLKIEDPISELAVLTFNTLGYNGQGPDIGSIGVNQIVEDCERNRLTEEILASLVTEESELVVQQELESIAEEEKQRVVQEKTRRAAALALQAQRKEERLKEQRHAAKKQKQSTALVRVQEALQPSEEAFGEIAAQASEEYLIQAPAVLSGSQSELSERIDNLTGSHKAIELYFDPKLEELLLQIPSLDNRTHVFRALLVKILDGLQLKKNKKNLEDSQKILIKYLSLIEREVLTSNVFVTQTLFPLVEASVNSQDTSTCVIGLKMLMLFFSIPKIPVDGKEVQLTATFLQKNHKDLDIVKARVDLEMQILTLRPRPNMGYPTLAQSFLKQHVLLNLDMCAEYLLACLETLQKSGIRHQVSKEEIECYKKLSTSLSHCSEEIFKDFVACIENFPFQKIKSSKSEEFIHQVFLEVFKREYSLEKMSRDNPETCFDPKDPINPLAALQFVCRNINKVSITTIIALKDHLNDLTKLVVRWADEMTPVTLLEMLDFLMKKVGEKEAFESQKSKAKGAIASVVIDPHRPIREMMILLFRGVVNMIPELLDEKKLYLRISEPLTALYPILKAFTPCFFYKNENGWIAIDRIEKAFRPETIQMVLDLLQSQEPAVHDFLYFAKTFSPIDCLKLCLIEGTKRLSKMEDTSEASTLRERLLELVEALLKSGVDSSGILPTYLERLLKMLLESNIESSLKLERLNSIFTGLTYVSTEERHDVIFALDRFLCERPICYKGHGRLYANHMYRLGIPLDPSEFPGTILKDDMKYERGVIQDIIESLVEQGTHEAVSHALGILSANQKQEFNGFLSELVELYEVVFAALRDLSPQIGLGLIEEWMKELKIEIEDGRSIFCCNSPESQDSITFNNLVSIIITSYHDICSKAIQEDPRKKITASQSFCKNIYEIVSRLNIKNLEELRSFKSHLDCLSTFIIDQGVTRECAKIINRICAAIEVVLEKSECEGKAFSFIEQQLLGKWDLLVRLGQMIGEQE